MARRVILDTGTLVAIERGSLDETRKQARSVRVEAVLASLPIEDYTLSVARIHARLAVEAMSKGKQRSAYGLMIAATAAATNRILITTDGKGDFGQLAGVRCEVIPIP